MPEFTKGPWELVKVKEGYFNIHKPDHTDNSKPIAVLDHSRDGHPRYREEITPANAHLVAAAPELYEALRAISHYAKVRAHVGTLIHDKCLNALAKAKGGPQ